MRRDELNLPDPPSTDRPGDQWICGRSDNPCGQGPGSSGNCPLGDACQPQRTWSGRRRQIVWTMLAVVSLLLLAASRSGVSSTVFKPGDLSRPHAQILAGTLTSQRCAACHTQASISPTEWFAGGQGGHQGVTQTDRCLDCHHQAIQPNRARFAHNLPRHVLRQLRSDLRLVSANSKSWHDALPGPAVEQDSIECAACHREHRGSEASLLSLSDSQCQTCHAGRFGSFAESHPNWESWPYGRGGVIAFNHQTHRQKHFPSTQQQGVISIFECASCHQVDDAGELSRSVSYESACQSCHDAALNLEVGKGFDLVAAPSLPEQVASELGDWPEAVTGFADGTISPFIELLFRRDADASKAFRAFATREFGDIDYDDSGQLAAAKQIAALHRKLLRASAARGHQSIIDRAATAGISVRGIEQIIRALPPQLLADAYDRWFGDNDRPGMVQNLRQRMLRLVDFDEDLDMPPLLRLAAAENEDSDLLLGSESGLSVGDDLLTDGGDLLSGDPLSVAEPIVDSRSTANATFDPMTMLPFGGWYRDDLRLSISYQGNGHADPVMRGIVLLASELSVKDPIRKRLLQIPAVSACVSCHPGATSATPIWKSTPLIGRSSDFTKFSHQPHLNVSQLVDCMHCHRIRSGAENSEQEINLVSHRSSLPEFEPMSRAACASCHTKTAAGDSCVHCHRYHIHR